MAEKATGDPGMVFMTRLVKFTEDQVAVTPGLNSDMASAIMVAYAAKLARHLPQGVWMAGCFMAHDCAQAEPVPPPAPPPTPDRQEN